MEIMDKSKLLEAHYKLAIDARDKLNDNYHKWMTYYYVANGAILVAITAIYNKVALDNGILLLAIIGLITCILWNLSCKGYYYWSLSWMNIIVRFERNIIQNDLDLGVYSIFSKEVFDKEDSVIIPNKPANISTPKLTLFFSYCAIISWLGFSIYRFFIQFPDWGIILKHCDYNIIYNNHNNTISGNVAKMDKEFEK
jgi:hypothetical protein